MKLTYIYHSGFAIETDKVALVIDYYKDTSEEHINRGFVHDYLLKRSGELYVLSSHLHPDHFNREIISWKEKCPNIHYIFSKDILKHQRASQEEAFYLDKGEIYEDEHLVIKAFGSTDAGISFLIKLQGICLFHAGDLNNWHWSEESTPQEIQQAEKDFLSEVSCIQQKYPAIDVVLFPVDSRMGKNYMLGAQQFVERIKTTIFVPMHFGENYQDGNAFRTFAEEKKCRFFSINSRGESFDIIK